MTTLRTATVLTGGALLVAVGLLLGSPHAASAQCNECWTCKPEHAKGRSGRPDILELDEGCAPGNCEDAIPCDGGPTLDDAALDRLAEAVRRNDAAGLIHLAETLPGVALQYVESRNALVVRGCGDSILALFPLQVLNLQLATAFPSTEPEHLRLARSEAGEGRDRIR